MGSYLLQKLTYSVSEESLKTATRVEPSNKLSAHVSYFVPNLTTRVGHNHVWRHTGIEAHDGCHALHEGEADQVEDEEVSWALLIAHNEVGDASVHHSIQ